MKIRDIIARTESSPSKSASTSERLQRIMDLRQIKQADLSRVTGISRGAISNYVIGRYEPKTEILKKLASALNCSEMWLCGYDVPMNNPTRAFDEEENPYELEMRDTFDTLDVEDQIFANNWLNSFAIDPDKMKKSPDQFALTEGEKALIKLFRKVPPDRQAMVIQMIEAALKNL